MVDQFAAASSVLQSVSCRTVKEVEVERWARDVLLCVSFMHGLLNRPNMVRCLRSHQAPKTGLKCTVCISGFMFNFFKNQLIKPPYKNILIEQAGCRLSASQWRRSWSLRWVPLWTACKDGGNQGLKWAAFQRLQLMNKQIWLMHITVQWFNFSCSAAWHCFQWWHEDTCTVIRK